jgi:hypothetical protein
MIGGYNGRFDGGSAVASGVANGGGFIGNGDAASAAVAAAGGGGNGFRKSFEQIKQSIKLSK